MAAQARMRSAKVLLINLGGLGTEIVKNLVLSGVGFLSLVDNHDVSEGDLSTQFFLSKDEIGTKRLDSAISRIQDMNPRVTLTVDTEDFRQKPDFFYRQFDLIIATDVSTEEAIRVNQLTRKFNVPFFLCGLNGLSGFIFVDLIRFDATDEKLKSSVKTPLGALSQNREVVEVTEYLNEEQSEVYERIVTRNAYKPFEQVLKEGTLKGKLTKRQVKRLTNAVPLTFALFSYRDGYAAVTRHGLEQRATDACVQLGLPSENLKQEYVEQFSQQAGLEFAPVSAVIGGTVAQDVINILGKKQSPLNNFIVLDGISLDMHIFEL